MWNIDIQSLEDQMTLTQELLPKTDEKTAKALLAKVDGLLDDARNGRDSLHRTYVEIGLALDEVENTKAWMVRHRSYDSYIKEHCEPKFGKSRTQLYGARAAAKYLLPEVSKEKLIEIGISRAMQLASYVKTTGKPAGVLLDKALDPKVDVDQFKAAIAEAKHERPEKGKWFDLGGFFCTPEEKEEIERGFKAAVEQGPLPQEASEWFVRKTVIQRLVMEFLSTYGAAPNANMQQVQD